MSPDALTTRHGPALWNRTVPRTRLFDALSLLLPAGEAFLIATLEQWRAQAGDSLTPHQQAELDRIVREERSHQRAHDRYNATLLAETPAAGKAAQRISQAPDDLAGFSMPMKMALVAAFEHLTALLSREVLERPYLLTGDDSLQSRLWRWHAREELEHSHIAIEAAEHYKVGRGRRALALTLATCYLAYDVLRCTWSLCRCDIAAGASRRQVLTDACRFAVGGLPSLARMTLGWWAYLVLPRSTSRRAV